MKKFSTLSRLFFAAALSLAALPSRADDAPTMTRRGNRFLFIVDTSYAMRVYSNAVVEGVADLLTSDMRGEFRRGDTIGLWLYNDKLDPQYPMQFWSKAGKDAIVDNMVAFLRGRRYEKQAHLEKVMPVLNQVIKTSERITIILIFGGTGSIQGTPFDKDIHTLQRKYTRELRSARVPFVIVLAARDGAVFDYTINYPGLVAIPHTANPEEPVATNAPVAAIAIPVAVTNAPVQTRAADSIILSHATNVVYAAAPAPAPVVAPVAPPPVAPVAPAPAPVSQPAIVATAPPPREVAPPPTQPVSPPVVAQQNPPPASETPMPQTPPVSMTANDQQPPSAPPVAQNVPVANIGPTGGAPFALFAMAFSLLVIAVVLVVFLVRRSRNAPQSSLITQSIDHPR
jgi:hypothetical protein